MGTPASASNLIPAELRASGRLWAFDFRVGAARILSEADGPDPAADWNWSHFALSDHRARIFLERLEDAPSAVRDILLGGETRLQAQAHGAWTYGVLADFEHEFDGRTVGGGRLNFACDGRRLFTTRRHPQHVVDCLRRQIENGGLQLAHPLDAVTHLVTGFIDATEEHLLKLGAQLDHAEDAVLEERGSLERLRLGPLRRELSGYHREFAGLRSAFQRARARRGGEHAGPLMERLAPILAEIEDYDRDIAGLQDRAKLLHDEIDAKLAAAANRSLRVLTILSTLLLPPTLIVGAFGMNLQGIPFADHAGGFWLAAALCTVVVAICAWALWVTRVIR